MEGLKQKTLISAKWNLLEKVINLGFEFAVGIVLARLLMPSDFGTIAIISVIISFSLIFVNSGFSQSLIRSRDVSNKDYSTVFVFNLIIGIVFYIIIYLNSTNIANFYQNNDLALYVKVLGLSIFISSLALVQRVNLTREMNFKLMSKINILSSLSSGILAIVIAFIGFGIWSLIAKVIFNQIFQTFLFWYFNRWKPSIIFELYILKRHFKYGSNFLISAIIGQAYNNILALTIGKIYNMQTLGYYNRAQLFSNVVSVNIESVMTSVSFPALAKAQDDKDRFLYGVRLLLKQAIYVIGILMVMLFFSAKIIIPFMLGKHWAEAGVYLQYLCIIGFFGVLNSILLNSISVTGRSNIYLNFQIRSLGLNIISLIFGYFYGIEVMLSLLIIFYVFLYLYISHVFNVFFSYSIFNQFKDFRILLNVIIPIILIGIIFSKIENSLFITGLMLITQFSFVYTVSSWLKIEEFELIKKLIFKK